MNTCVVGIAAGVTGLAVGGTLAYFVTKEYYSKISEKEIAEARDHYKSLTKTTAEVKPSEGIQDPDAEVKEMTMKGESKHTNYSGMSAVLNDVPVAVEKNFDAPYTITFDDYENKMPSYNKETVTYYEEADSLVDTEGRQIDVNATISYKMIDTAIHDIQEETWVRNDVTRTDYYVIINPDYDAHPEYTA